MSYTPWEYVVRSFDEPSDAALTAKLDEEGTQEWELVAFDFSSGRAIFKRPREQANSKRLPPSVAILPPGASLLPA